MLRDHVRPFSLLAAALALVAVSSCKNRPPEVPPAPTGPVDCCQGALVEQLGETSGTLFSSRAASAGHIEGFFDAAFFGGQAYAFQEIHYS